MGLLLDVWVEIKMVESQLYITWFLDVGLYRKVMTWKVYLDCFPSFWMSIDEHDSDSLQPLKTICIDPKSSPVEPAMVGVPKRYLRLQLLACAEKKAWAARQKKRWSQAQWTCSSFWETDAKMIRLIRMVHLYKATQTCFSLVAFCSKHFGDVFFDTFQDFSRIVIVACVWFTHSIHAWYICLHLA